MCSFTRVLQYATRAGAFVGALSMAAPAAAAPVIGDFTATIFRIDFDDVAAAPFFPYGAVVTGQFGYDTDAAVDMDPAPDRGLYTFSETAFMSITVEGATYTTDPSLGPVNVRLSIFPGNQSFVISGGLVPEDDVPLAAADVPLSLTLVNGLVESPLFVPSDALPTSTFSLTPFSDPNGTIGAPGATPYLVFFQLRSISITSASPVPEPSTAALLGWGLFALLAARRRGV